MYDPNNITFTMTYRNVQAIKPLADQLEFLGRGYKKAVIDKLVMAAANLAKDNPQAIQKIANGQFSLRLL